MKKEKPVGVEGYSYYFEKKNVQPGRAAESGLPVCPIYDLLKECSGWAGVTAEELQKSENFCGFKIRMKSLFGGIESWMPTAMCSEICTQLTFAINRAKSKDKSVLERWQKIAKEEHLGNDVAGIAAKKLKNLKERGAGFGDPMCQSLNPGENCRQGPKEI
jgi:hypothetical protein